MARSTFSAILADRAGTDPDEPVVVDDAGELSAAELDRSATSLAHRLVRLGVRRDDTVIVALPNSRDFVIACMGIWRAGATPQPVDPGLDASTAHALAELSRPSAVIGARSANPMATWVSGVQAPADSRSLPDLAAACWKATITSGSTGDPKIVRAAAPALLDPDLPVTSFLPQRATQLVAGPLWHSAVFTYAFRGLLTGHRLIIMDRFEPQRWVDLVQRHQVTWGLLVPTMMSRLLRLPADRRTPAQVATIERILHMGAPCPERIKRGFLDWLGPQRVDEVYAGSESNGLTHITGSEWLQHPGSVGRGIGGTTISIRDRDGVELPVGQLGWVWMHRGETAAYDYLGARSRRSADGWDTLADLGYLDPDGYLHLHDRADDLINRGGDKIAPASVEAVLESHPDVLEAVAFGVPDDDLGEVVHAVVRLAEDSRETRDVLAHAVAVLGVRAPAVLHPTTKPIRNDAGKIRRRSLRAHVCSEPDI